MKKSIVYSFIAFLFLPMFAVEAATVVNSVSSHANSGGNKAESGQVVEGKTKAEVSVQTSVDGNVVENIHETDESTSTASVEVNTTVNNSTATPKTEVKIGGSVKQTVAVESHASTTVAATEKSTKTVSGTLGFKIFVSKVWSTLKHVFTFWK